MRVIMKISIITVCYNSVATLATAIESVLGQTYPDIEHIVVDGGSKDGTVEIIRKYADEKCANARIRECANENTDAGSDRKIRQSGTQALRQFLWISEPDEGMYDAINKGIRMATGDVIGILNADDFLADDGVIDRIANEFLTIRLREYDSGGQAKIDVVYGDVRFVKNCLIEEGERTAASTNELMNYHTNALASLRDAKTLRYYSSRHWQPWMLRWGFMPPHPSVYIRRGCFERLGPYKTGYHIAADYELLIRYLWKGGLKTVYMPQCLVSMRTGGKSTKNWRSNLVLNQEIVRGNRENGYFCCLPMLAPKYFFKIWEFVLPAICHRRND